MDFDGIPNDPCIDSPAVDTHVALIRIYLRPAKSRALVPAARSKILPATRVVHRNKCCNTAINILDRDDSTTIYRSCAGRRRRGACTLVGYRRERYAGMADRWRLPHSPGDTGPTWVLGLSAR